MAAAASPPSPRVQRDLPTDSSADAHPPPRKSTHHADNGDGPSAAPPRRPKPTRRRSRRLRPNLDRDLAGPESSLVRRAGAALGVFGRARWPAGMDSLIDYLSTWGGTDKALMFSQYLARLLVALSAGQHRTRDWFWKGPTAYSAYGGSPTARRFAALSDACADARTLFRVWSILPVIRWVCSPFFPRSRRDAAVCGALTDRSLLLTWHFSSLLLPRALSR